MTGGLSPFLPHHAITLEIEEIGRTVLDAAFVVHSEMGPGLLESIYRDCLAEQLRSMGRRVECEVPVEVQFRGKRLSNRLRLDMLVDDEVVVEVKAASDMHPIFVAQLQSYLRLSERKIGYVLNFNVVRFRTGIQRVIWTVPSPRG